MKWLKATEIQDSGFYLFIRTDDEPISVGNNPLLIRVGVVNGFPYTLFTNSGKVKDINPLTTWDDQCRFFGPIPDITE